MSNLEDHDKDVEMAFMRKEDMEDGHSAQEALRRRLLIAETVTRIEKEVRELQDSVNQKQNKIGMGVLIPFLGYLFTQLLLGVWWASEVTQTIKNLEEKIVISSQDRFYGRDGEKLEQLIELKGENTNLRLKNLELEMSKLEQENDNNHNRIHERLRMLERPNSDRADNVIRPYVRKPEVDEMLRER